MTREELIGLDPDFDLLTAREVAAILRVGRDVLYEMIRNGEAPGGFKLGRAWRFRRSVIDKYIHDREARERR
jgi:excisionase family DNA binding protein